jgi:hypothetical protein
MLDTSIEPNAFDNRFAGDNKLYVVFHMRAVQNGFRSEQEGRPIFDDLLHPHPCPGDKTTIIEEPVNGSTNSASRCNGIPGHDAKSKGRAGALADSHRGPGDELAQRDDSEQLAGMSDTNAQRFMGGHELRRKANTFLKVSKDTAEAQRLVTENAELKERIGKQEDTLKQLAVRLEAM